MTKEFVGKALTVSADNYRSAAEYLDCDLAAIKAVTEVEARGNGFLFDKRPVILFERHKFSRFTDGNYDSVAPDISNRKAGGYESGGEHQYERLYRAIKLDRDAALRSASWGMFQIMGFNHQQAGFDDVESFVEKMCESEGAHLRAFVDFVRSDRAMAAALRAHRWAEFARRYNGSGYRKNRYDEKLADAYARFVENPLEDPEQWSRRILRRGDRGAAVVALQKQLNELGASPELSIDGEFGPATEEAVRQMQRKIGLTVDGIVGPKSWQAFTGEDDESDPVRSMAPTADLEGDYAHYSEVDQEAWSERWPNFSPREIACRGTGRLKVNERALDCLQNLRDRLGVPMTINSAYRSPEHNRKVGGVQNSKHLEGIAFDVSTRDLDRKALVNHAIDLGFRGFGYYKSFIHIDTRDISKSWGNSA